MWTSKHPDLNDGSGMDILMHVNKYTALMWNTIENAVHFFVGWYTEVCEQTFFHGYQDVS